MLKLGRRFKEYREAGAFHTLVPIDSAIDEHTLATKAGDLVVFLGLRGIDPECLEAGQLDKLTRRFETAVRVFDERFRVYLYHFKRTHPDISGEHHANAVIEEALQSRLQFLNQKAGQHYIFESAIAVVYEGWRDARDAAGLRGHPLTRPFRIARGAFSVTQTREALVEELNHARELLLSKAGAFAVQLREFVEVTVLDRNAAFRVQRQLLNYSAGKAEDAPLHGNHFLDYQACASTLECHREYLRLDDDYVAVLTLKEPPPQTFAFMLSNLDNLACAFVTVTEWKRESTAKVRRLIQSRRRHFHNSKSSLVAHLSSGPPGAPADVLIDSGAVALVGNLGACLEEIEVRGRHFGEFSLTLIVHEKDESALRRAVAQVLKAFAIHGASLNEERYNRLNAWLAPLPGNAAFNLRRLWLTDTNYADLSLLFSPLAGAPRNEPLGRESLAVLEGHDGSPYFFNLHFQDVAHTLVCGATGSGKSFLLNFLVTHLQKYDPVIRIFDLGHSYESLTRLFNGRYLPIRSEERPFTINPFSLPPTRENLLFLLDWVRVLVETGGAQIHPDDVQDLYEQIENLYEIAPEQRRLSTLANIVHANLRRPLQRWCQGGPYGSLFDHAEDTLTLAPFQTFDFEGMDNGKEILEPLLFYVLHRANVAIHDDPARFKVFVMDEAWRFFAHPVTRTYIVEALKTWRKKNACMVLATQSVDDLIGSAMLPVVMESCPSQIFLANPRMDQNTYRQAFHLNEREVELVAGLAPKREMLLKRPDHSKVLQLNVGPKEYWIYTNNASDNVRKRDAFARYGFEKGLEQLTREKV